MGHKDHGHISFGLLKPQQIKNLVLNGDIEGRSWLVGKE
tara:strand:- start:107 stop:223 length:117 start_codon:yes stop_codon:yes gene_type:complete